MIWGGPLFLETPIYYIDIPRTPTNDLFLKVNPHQNKAFSNQNKGHFI